MLPAVVFFPNALYLQEKETNNNKPKKKTPKKTDFDFFELHLYSLLFSSWDKWKRLFFALKSVII